ncbi:hypothetical protein [Streptomyces sp. PvR034]|uniref:hypothetical protein n=1 Tax=Streptomyces sp. PvR034 TaxID=3156401 RepID=UPI0033997EAF
MHKQPVTDVAQGSEEQRLHYERWQWGGRLPVGRLRLVSGGNVLGLVEFDRDLVHALGEVGPEVQRAVALLAARRACETAGLTEVAWVARALTALAQGDPLPPPFDNGDRMRETLRSTPLAPRPTVLGAVPPERAPYFPLAPAGYAWVPAPESRDDGWTPYVLDRLPGSSAPTVSASLLVGEAVPVVPGPISQPHFALPAVLGAAQQDPLRAALEAVWHAVHTFGEHYPELLEDVWALCAEPADKEAAGR